MTETMQHIKHRTGPDSLQKPIGELVAQFGALPVLLAALRASLRRRRRALSEDQLSPQMRRDLNLRVDPPSPRHWDYL